MKNEGVLENNLIGIKDEGRVKVKRNTYIGSCFKKLLRNKLATVAFIIIVIELILIIGAPLFTPYNPYMQNLKERLIKPTITGVKILDYGGNPIIGSDGNAMVSARHIFGTDNLGRDMWSRILYGGRISLSVGFFATFIGMSIGVTLGLVAAYYKKLDSIIMRVMDVMFAFPGMLLAMLIVSILGSSLINVTLAISIWSIPVFCRLVRGEALKVKENDYIKAAKSLGFRDTRIIVKHILPNCLAPIIIYGTMRMATAILSIASLSYLGIGAQPPLSEWGTMVAAGRDYMYDAPHMMYIPGIVIMVTMLAFNILGDSLRDILDPKLNNK